MIENTAQPYSFITHLLQPLQKPGRAFGFLLSILVLLFNLGEKKTGGRLLAFIMRTLHVNREFIVAFVVQVELEHFKVDPLVITSSS